MQNGLASRAKTRPDELCVTLLDPGGSVERPVGVSHPKWVPTGHLPESVSRELSERKQRGVSRCGHRLKEPTVMNQFSREEVRVANEAVRPLRIDDIDNEDRLRMADTSPSVVNATHKFASSIPLLKDIVRGSTNQDPEVVTMTERVRIAEEP